MRGDKTAVQFTRHLFLLLARMRIEIFAWTQSY